MSSYLISKADFPEFVPLSLNVADELVNPYIRDAYEFDIAPLFTAAEWALLTAARGLVEQPAEAPAVLALWEPLRALWVCQAFRLFLRWHGTHITPNGVEAFADGGQLPVSGARRAELIADIDGRVARYAARLATALRAYRPATTTTCGTHHRRRPGRSGLQSHAI